MARGKRKVPDINSSSTADIAFLLLIFFLITTSMDTDRGLARLLPPPPEDEKNENTDKIKERNILKDNPANAIKSLLGLVLLAVVLIVAWAMGDGTPMQIPGYSGTDNVPFWLKVTDMFLYSIYILLFVTVVAIIASGIKKKLS